MKNGKTGMARLVSATVYSWQGFVAAYRHEEAFRQELWLAIAGTGLAFWLARSPTQFLLLVVPLLLIILAEMVNSAIEATVDRFGGEQHELSGRAKDMGSATVFVSLTIAALCWLTILAENLLL